MFENEEGGKALSLANAEEGYLTCIEIECFASRETHGCCFSDI
jgi:hypothetical protein